MAVDQRGGYEAGGLLLGQVRVGRCTAPVESLERFEAERYN